MPDIKQSLRDFVATSNSGKYSDEKVLLSKFPELSGYDINSLKDFVATSNSGKYANEDELLSKFPEFKTGTQPAAVQPPVKKKSLVSPSPWEGIMSSVVPSAKTEQQPAVSSSVKKAEAPVDLNKGTEKGEIYKGLPIKGFEDKSYVLKNVNGIDVWQEYNPKNRDVVIGKANKYLALDREGHSTSSSTDFSGGEKQRNAKLALTQLAGKLGIDVSSFDGPDDIYQKIKSSKELGETYKNITDPTRIKTLNQYFKAQASTTEGVQTYVGYPEKGKEDNEYKISELPITKEKVWEVKRKGQGEFTVISDEGSINALNNWTGNKVEPNNDAKTKRDAQIARQESAVNNFKLVNSKMFDLAEEDAVPYLQKMYGKYGFNFSESGDLLKDEVTVTSKNGGKPFTVSLDNWTQGADASEAAALRRWMIENQSTGDYIDKERKAVKQAQDDYRNSKYEQEKLTPEQIELQSTSDLQRPIISNPLDAKNKLSAPAEFKQELAANTIMTNKINAQRRLSDLSNNAKTQKQKDEVATIAVANQNVLKQESDVQATYLNDLSKQNKQLNNSVFKLKQDSERFYNAIKQQGVTAEQLNTDPELLRQKQELDERAKSIEAVSKNLSADMSAIQSLNKENEKNAGLYIAFNENRGNVMGGLVNSVLKGVGALPDAILNNISGGDNNFASNALISLLGSDYTTEEFMKSEDRWDFTKAAFGGLESLGAMATGAGLGKIATGSTKLMALSKELPFFALSYNELKSEMKGPEWDGATTAEKEGLALIYAYINGKLEKLGTDALIDTGKIGKDVSKNLILKTIAGLKPGATTEAMDLALQTNFKKFILSSAYTLGKDFASEAKTGAMQELTGITLKNTYNLVKGKEMFKEVPNTVADITDAVISGAYMEGLGGLAFSMPKVAVDAGKFGYSKAFKDPEKLAFAEKIFNDSDMRVMILNDLKTKIASGEITKEEGQERVDAINNTVSLFEKLPDGLKEEDKPKTLDLLVEKSKLEQDIKGKDEALIVPQKERITEINNELTNISKNATKEGNITESNLTERENGNEVGKTTETSGSNSTVESGKNQKEVTIEGIQEEAGKPTIVNMQGVESKVTFKDGFFVKKDEWKNMTPEQLSGLIFTNPTKEMKDVINNAFSNKKTEETSNSKENKKKVEQLRADERAELAEAIPNIDDYKVDGKIDKSLMDKPTLAKYEEIYNEFDKLITPFLPKKEVIQKEEDVLVPTEELDILKEDIEKRKDEGSLGINLGEKVFMGDTPGMIRIDPENENTIVFETNDKIIVLGNVDEVGDSDIASFGLSLFPPTGTLVTGDTNAITYNGKNYKIIGRRRDKKGKAVVRVKDLDTGLEKRIIGQDAENILKDYALSKEKKVQPLKLSVEQKETPVAKKSEKAKKENPVNVDSTLEELAKEEERLRQEAIDFENSLAEDISKESKKESNLIFSIKGNEFSVTLKNDGTFSVSQKNDKGKFVGIKDQAKRDLAINEYKKIKSDKDTSRLKQAEELSSMFKKEQEDKILDLLNKAIKATSSNGRAFDATLGIPLFVANKSLEIVKAAYLINKNILESIKKGYDFISKNGYKVSEYDFKKFVYDNINAPTEETKQEKEVKSPSAKKILGIKDKKVTVTERVALNDQLRLEAKAAREASKNIKDQQKFLTAVVKNLAKTGKITASQSANLLRRLAYLNVNNPKTVNEFLSYAQRLFANAEYSDKVDKGFKAKAKIKAKLKSKNQAQVTAIAKDFATIDPSLVTDIDKYNEMADAMLAAIAPSVSGVKKNEEGEYEANNKLKTPIVIADVQAYVEKELKAQKEIEKQRLLSYYKKLVEAGILNDKMSIEEIREVVANENNDEDKLTAKERAKIVMDDLKERFEVAKSAIEDILGEKVNVERDEEIDALNDDETYTLIYPSKDEIPEFLKDSVSSFSKTTARKGLFGKKKTSENYKVVATGKKIKEKYYSFEKQNEDISKADREIIQRLMSLDLTDMKIKDAMALVDAANNFITNGITAGLQGEIPKHEGDAVVKKLEKNGLVAKSIGFLRGFGTKMKTIGSVYATQVLNPRMMANTLFGQNRGVEFMRLIGFDKLSSGVSKASERAKDRFKEYSKQFTKTKPNGKRFGSPFNRYERGIYASLLRSPIGTEFEQKQAFDKAVDEAFHSTKKLLESGDSAKVRKGKIYQEIIDKLGLANEDVSIKSVQSKVDPTNLEAVDFWIQTWNDYYGDLYDLSLGVYNTILDRDSNYTPTRKSKIDVSVKDKDSDLLKNEGAFASFMNLGVNKNKAGVLEEKSRALSGQNTYQDYDFDGNNKEGFEAALMDIYTAEAIRKIEGALNSDAMKSIIPVTDTRERFKEKLERYINIKKGRREPQDRDIKNFERTVAVIAKFVTGRTLGTISAMPAQFIAPAMTTLFNTGRLDFSDALNPDARAWAKNEGVSTLMRGQENFDSINRRNEQSILDAFDKNGNFDAALTAVEKYYDFWLKNFLVLADRGIANISWFSYYKQSLKRQGLSTNIDWKNHEKNDKAFAYANSMIDKNQNPSDSDMQGNLYSSKKAGIRIMRNAFAPYSSFTMNAKARAHTDLVNVLNYEDNGAQGIIDSVRSLVAGLLEVATFHTVKNAIRFYILREIAMWLFGGDEDDEEYKKLKKQYEDESKASVIKDIFSPAPIADYYTMEGVNYYIEKSTESELKENNEKKLKDAYEKDKEGRILKGDKEISYDDFKIKYIKEEVSKNKFFNPSEDQVGGVYAGGVKIQKQLADLYNLGYNKKISVKDYQGEYVGEKIVSDEAAEAGKKAFYLTLMHEAGLLPGEASSISRMILKKAKTTAEKPNIKKVADDFKKDLELKELTQYQKDMIKSGTNLENVIKNEWFIVQAGGLKTKQKQDDFKKVKDVFGSNVHVYNIVTDINDGMSAAQIIKKNKEQLLEIQSEKEKVQPEIIKAKSEAMDEMIKDIKSSRK